MTTLIEAVNPTNHLQFNNIPNIEACVLIRSQEYSVGVWLDCGLEHAVTDVQFPAKARNILVFWSVALPIT